MNFLTVPAKTKKPDYKTDTVESFIEWTKTGNVTRCSKNILAAKKVQTEFFGSLLANVLMLLGFLDREVSNVTVHSQAAVQLKESDNRRPLSGLR